MANLLNITPLNQVDLDQCEEFGWDFSEHVESGAMDLVAFDDSIAELKAGKVIVFGMPPTYAYKFSFIFDGELRELETQEEINVIMGVSSLYHDRFKAYTVAEAQLLAVGYYDAPHLRTMLNTEK